MSRFAVFLAPLPRRPRLRVVSPFAAAGLLLTTALALTLTGCERLRRAEPELEALVEAMLPRIAELAALEVRGPVRLEMRTREGVRRFVEQRLDEEFPPEELDALRRTYALLGLLPDTLDLRALLRDLYTEQVIGYYDPGTRRLYIVEGVPRAVLRPVLVHELVHALQHQHADLDSLVGRARGNDRQTAAHAALEGHAMLVMFAYLAEAATGARVEPELLPNPAEELEASFALVNEEFPVFQRAPRIIQRSLLFPYVGGAGFVHQLWRHRPAEAARRAPLGELLPQSTAQVLHPLERFIRARDEPLELRFADEPAWRVRLEDTFGEFEMRVYLEEHLGGGAAHDARGWAGDRFRLLQDGTGRAALVWYSVWQDEAAADRFAAAVERVARLGDEARYAIERVEIEGMAAVLLVTGDDAAVVAAAPRGNVYISDERP